MNIYKSKLTPKNSTSFSNHSSKDGISVQFEFQRSLPNWWHKVINTYVSTQYSISIDLKKILHHWHVKMSDREERRKVINWEICKKFKFDHAKKWYMHNPASVLENDTHKLLWDFDIQTDHLISIRRPGVIIINKKKENLQNCRYYCPGWQQNKTERM